MQNGSLQEGISEERDAVTELSVTTEAAAFYDELPSHDVEPLWRALGKLLPAEPKSPAVPYLWRYADLRPLLMRAGDVVTAEEAERRVLMLMNPGLQPTAAAAVNLYAGLQLILPGEVATAHQHAAAALRFVIEGEGAYTAVSGERTIMRPGDLVLTPAWAFHDHGNTSDCPMIWLDGLDLPLINHMHANFFGGALEHSQEELVPVDSTTRLYAAGRLNPQWRSWREAYSPVVNYPWTQTAQILAGAAAVGEGSPHDGVIFDYTNPYSGGPVLPTMSCSIQLLSAGLHTEAHRHTVSAVYHVVRGAGTTIVDGVTIDWAEHDTFVVPGWKVHEHVNHSGDDAVLFSFTDAPVIRALGFERETAMPRQA
jgi:gentisate 1,2-dioxygenase